MPNCDFFACGDDHRVILEYLFDSLSCRVFELYSAFDSELAEFTTLNELKRHYDIQDWTTHKHGSLHLQIYADNALGPVNFRRIDLNPAKCDGATFRYSTEGWGLIQLYLESPRGDSLANSHTNHNSEARANKWASVDDRLDSPDSWDWKSVTSFSQKLNRFIRKQAIAKKHTRVVLPSALDYVELD